jgi:hypothetical protein
MRSRPSSWAKPVMRSRFVGDGEAIELARFASSLRAGFGHWREVYGILQTGQVRVNDQLLFAHELQRAVPFHINSVIPARRLYRRR